MESIKRVSEVTMAGMQNGIQNISVVNGEGTLLKQRKKSLKGDHGDGKEYLSLKDKNEIDQPQDDGCATLGATAGKDQEDQGDADAEIEEEIFPLHLGLERKMADSLNNVWLGWWTIFAGVWSFCAGLVHRLRTQCQDKLLKLHRTWTQFWKKLTDMARGLLGKHGMDPKDEIDKNQGDGQKDEDDKNQEIIPRYIVWERKVVDSLKSIWIGLWTIYSGLWSFCVGLVRKVGTQCRDKLLNLRRAWTQFWNRLADMGKSVWKKHVKSIFGRAWTGTVGAWAVCTGFVLAVGTHCWDKWQNMRRRWRQFLTWLTEMARAIWRNYADSILTVTRWLFYIIVALAVLRMLYMVFAVQDEVQSFEEFVKEKDRKYAKIVDEQNIYVDNLFETQNKIKDHLESVEKVSQENSASHNGELAEIKHSIVEIKDDFQKFMVESQMHIIELQQKNQKLQEGMIGMQEDMNQEMGKMRGDVNDVRNQHRRMKESLDSIDYNIRNLKNCGFFARLFGSC